MAFSSVRNAAPRPEHKERRQPKSRLRLGLLEKHKDYVLRARNYHNKEQHIKILREKARLRNPDAFYFAMQSSKTNQDIHQVSRKDFTPEMIRLMKTQDYSYVLYQRRVLENKLSTLEEGVPKTDFSKPSKHLIFSDDDGCIEVPTLDPVTSDSKLKQIDKMRGHVENLKKIEREMTLKSQLTYSKGKRVKVGQTENGADIYKWRAERQK
jgi:U3 small nucleolar RNA-associated protein 11